MPTYTVHIDRLYTVEAEDADEALNLVKDFAGRPLSSKFHIAAEATDEYVTDDMGEVVR